MAVKYTQAVIFEAMTKTSMKQLCYALFISFTFLSFGCYVVCGGLKFKTENVSDHISEENTESSKEASKELTNSYLSEKVLLLNQLISYRIYKCSSIKVKVPFVSLQPSTPPPDLLES